MNVVLLRHGETEWSRTHRHTGRTDIPLTDTGRAEATRAGAALAGREFAQVWSSPLVRARETARLAGFEPDRLDDRLLEWDYGAYEGRTTVSVREERPGWWLWRDGCPGGESPGDVEARVDALLEEARAEDGDVLLVAHGHLLRALGARWIGAPIEIGGRLFLGTAAICSLGVERGVDVIKEWNRTPAE